DDERLADGIQRECQIHRVADTSINALRNELMLFPYLQGDRPIRAKVSVRAVEEPAADDQARHTADERAVPQRVLSQRERRRYDPDQRDEESHPGQNQEPGLQRRFPAPPAPPAPPLPRPGGGREEHHSRGTRR